VGRNKEFDTAAVLRRAVEIFVERGYGATSVADLVEHLGIARSSLYSTFGSKSDLYQAAMRFYLHSTQPPLLESLARPGPALPAVRTLIRGLAEDARRAPRRSGCLLVSAIMEQPEEAPEAEPQVRESWRALEASLTSALARAQAQGELGGHHSAAELAAYYVVLIQGLYVVAQVAPDDGPRLSAAVKQALALLD
jgi:TetR/AcrR family transcriptional regulator, transcriptional repressor for nem operon